MIKCIDLRKGAAVRLDGKLYVVHSMEHVAKGNKRSHIQLQFKAMADGKIIPKRMRPADSIEDAFLERRDMEYLYEDGAQVVLQDTRTYEQAMLSRDLVAAELPYMPHNSTVKVCFCDGKPVSVELPAAVVLEVTKAEPAARGNTVSNVLKPVETETGLEVKVPGHVKEGDGIKVDTRTGEFLERASR